MPAVTLTQLKQKLTKPELMRAAKVPFASMPLQVHAKLDALQGGRSQVHFVMSAPVFEVRDRTWNKARMQELAAHKAEKILKVLTAPDYTGPNVESAQAVREFLAETIPHTVRVRRVVEQLGGDASTHDLVERVSLHDAQVLAHRLGKTHDVSWLWLMIARARNDGQKELEVGKLVPQVVAGLARSGRPDLIAIEVHRRSGHHKKGGVTAPLESYIEMATDVVDALVSPRTYKKGMSYEAATKIFWDMVEKKQASFPDTAESRALFARVIETHKLFAATVWK